MRDRFRDNWDGANHVSLGFLDVLTLIFITLKLTDVINWSWWAVLIFCVGVNLVWGKKIKVANLLPAIVAAVIAAFLPI